ncbi:cob(I)yrinic acid a,c-diamide adenosyltransferase [Spirochaetia bacterium 38H-sp]|uniref:Corrinoid adenosyltransferase n=1 Tax=Rarispira pelagica TaxID=3141764 RepID=A0ABU9UFT8_9SPIR
MIDFEGVTTRGGDGGLSSLASGRRLSKNELVFDVLGGIDELSSWLGLVKAYLQEKDSFLYSCLEKIQSRLIIAAGQVAEAEYIPDKDRISNYDVEELEKWEKWFMERVELPDHFILPGKNIVSAHADVSRTVCRRLERLFVAYCRDDSSTPLSIVMKYINRLSDFLFVVARWLENPSQKDSTISTL